MDDLNITLNIVRQIKIDMATGMNREQLYHKYTEFAADKPKSFNHTVDGNFDEDTFIKMMQTYSNKHTSAVNDKAFEATTAIGEMLAEKYLYPKVGKPSDDDKSKALAAVKLKVQQEQEKKV
jgi:hypothetical protein